jgi:hypothetical protein
MARALLLLIPLLAAALAGCAGGDAGQASDGEGADAGGVGSVAGQVLDDEQRPVADAAVSLAEANRSTSTSADGSFALDDVPAGEYTLNVLHEAFEIGNRTVTVTADDTVDLLVTLIPLPSDDAFHETFPFVGIQQCMWYTSVFKSGCGYPYTAAYYTAHDNGVNLSQYGAPPDVFDNNYRYNFSVRAEHTAIVSELAWEAGTDAAKFYTLELSCAWYDPVVDDCVAPGQTTWEAGNTYARARGVSPLRIEWTSERPDWLPWVMSRAYLSGDAAVPLGAALEQKVTMYNTVFYGAPPPVGFQLAVAPS